MLLSDYYHKVLRTFEVIKLLPVYALNGTKCATSWTASEYTYDYES
jgi:hypothetical protein